MKIQRKSGMCLLETMQIMKTYEDFNWKKVNLIGDY